MSWHLQITRNEWGDHRDALALMAEFAQVQGALLATVPVRERRAAGAERLTNRAFLVELGESFPTDGLIAPLGHSGSPRHGRAWTVALDGVQQYMLGLSDWSIAIALLAFGRPVAGMVYFPIRRTYYLASTERPGAYRNGHPIAPVAPPTDLALAGLGVDLARNPMPTDALVWAARDDQGQLRLEASTPPLPALALGCAIAEGGLAGAILQTQEPWVVAPLAVLLPPLGAQVTSANGGTPRYDDWAGDVVLSSGAPLHGELLTLWATHLKRQAVPIEDLGLTPATVNCLHFAGIRTLAQLLPRLATRPVNIPNFSTDRMNEVEARLAERGISLVGQESRKEG